MINLMYATDTRYGGWPSYFAHLVHGFRAAHIDHAVWRLGNRTETKEREFGLGITYTNLSLNDSLKLCRKEPMILTAMNFKEPWIGRNHELIEAGAFPVIHDPNDLRPRMKEALQLGTRPIITIRKKNKRSLIELGHEAVYFPHPYMPKPVSPNRELNAVSLSRIDFEKHIEIIAQANKMLPEDKRVKIHGFIFRPYAQHTLDIKFDGWRDDYIRRWHCHDLYGGVDIASTAHRVVDMSWIKDDGGGTQYTFLEAWNAGAKLILHDNWLTGNPKWDVVEDACKFISSPEELADELARPVDADKQVWSKRNEAAKDLLRIHDAKRIAKKYSKFIQEAM